MTIVIKRLCQVTLALTVSFLFCAASGADDGNAGIAEDHFLADTHVDAGLVCSVCHKESPPAKRVETAVCVACHLSGDALAETTAEIEPNPHASHKGEQPCESCHHAHKPSVDACAQCHTWGYKVP